MGLNGWEKRYISFGGRIAVVKSVLSSIPLYYLSLYKAPIGVLKKMESMLSKFLWGSYANGKRKITWIRWGKLCYPKKQGGLGIKALKQFNLALMGRWGFRILNESNSLWRQALSALYGPLNVSNPQPTRYDSIWWKDINKWILTSNWFKMNLAKQIGDGASTKFWKERWAGSTSIAELFPNLYSNAADKEIVIADKGVYDRTWQTWRWNWNWMDPCTEEQMSDLQNLISKLDTFPPGSGALDQCIWRPTNTNNYITSEIYTQIMQEEWQAETMDTEIAKVWSNSIPSKISAFCWQSIQNRIPTVDNLEKRGVNIDSILCPLCLEEHETVEHLLLYCPVSQEIWRKCFNWLGIPAIVPTTLKEVIVHDRNQQFPLKTRTIWKTIWELTFWAIWKLRNEESQTQRGLWKIFN